MLERERKISRIELVQHIAQRKTNREEGAHKTLTQMRLRCLGVELKYFPKLLLRFKRGVNKSINHQNFLRFKRGVNKIWEVVGEPFLKVFHGCVRSYAWTCGVKIHQSIAMTSNLHHTMFIETESL